MNTAPVSYSAVLQARQRLAGGVHATACTAAPALSHRIGMEIICHHEFRQVTGSFKERGARNALLCLSPEQKRSGVIAASAGNHAQGLAFHGRQLGIAVTVVMPKTAPLVKVARCRKYGARVLLAGESFCESTVHAGQLAAAQGLALIHPFDDPAVIAGQGTLALDTLDQVPDLDALIVPVGGGGLIAGCAAVLRTVAPQVELIGVEPAHAPSLTVALSAGHPTDVPVHPSFADGLSVTRVGELSYATCRDVVSRVVTVTEDELAEAMLSAQEVGGWILEGAGAAGLAACLSGRLTDLEGKKVVVLLTGANIDPAKRDLAFARARFARRSAQILTRAATTVVAA